MDIKQGGDIVANIKSAKKRIKIIAKKTLRNKMIKSQTKTAIKKLIASVTSGDQTQANVALVNAVSTIDKAASKGIFHKNNASRKKSRLTKMVSKMEA